MQRAQRSAEGAEKGKGITPIYTDGTDLRAKTDRGKDRKGQATAKATARLSASLFASSRATSLRTDFLGLGGVAGEAVTEVGGEALLDEGAYDLGEGGGDGYQDPEEG